MKKHQLIERSIIKNYRQEIWSKFIKAVKTYNLVAEGDKIAVCLSGGKDSFLLAKCMQELQKHGQQKFDVVFLLMDPGYDKNVLKKIKTNAQLLNIPLEIFTSNIFAMVKGEKKACYLCARKRRGYLYAQAKELGCNKIALGHHFDDVVETILMNIIHNGRHQTMLPKLKSKNFNNISLIRPLYFVEENAIKKWMQYNNLVFTGCACPNIIKQNSQRDAAKNLIATLTKENPYIKKNIFNASKNVNLDALLGYRKEKSIIPTMTEI